MRSAALSRRSRTWSGSPVDDRDYKVPFRFNGRLDKLTLTIDRPKLPPEDIKKLKMAMHGNPASE